MKAYLDERADFDPYLERPHLRVFVARPEYLLAMKCASMRLAEEFRDLEDVRYPTPPRATAICRGSTKNLSGRALHAVLAVGSGSA